MLRKFLAQIKEFAQKLIHRNRAFTETKPYPITLYGGQLVVRGTDTGGSGEYGASRNDHVHQGTDFLCEPHGNVFAPYDGELTRVAAPYKNDSRFSGLEFNFLNGTTMKVFYCVPNAKGYYKKGDIIGKCQDISQKYKSVPTHIHVEVRQNGVTINPVTFLL